jgi:hypothetical protein
MVRNIFLSIICLFNITNCIAQETVERKNRLTDSVIERFSVLKSDPSIKHGLYKAFFQRKTLVASGNYSNGKKSGKWIFYDTDGKMVEKYDYDTNTLYYEAPLDAATDLNYFFDKKTDSTDRVTRPLKIGGAYFGFVPYVSLFRMPFDTFEINTNSFQAYVELLISPGGRLADYKVYLISRYYQYNQTLNMDVNLFSEADKTFIPATINGEPVLCRIFIHCWVTPDGSLDFF